jgi:hypothetical protein
MREETYVGMDGRSYVRFTPGQKRGFWGMFARQTYIPPAPPPADPPPYQSPPHVEPITDAFPLLGLRAPFKRADVIGAFRRQSLKMHPDHGGDAARFRALLAERDRAMVVVG